MRLCVHTQRPAFPSTRPCAKIAGPPAGGLEAPVSKPVALITGASRGIGKQLAIDLAADGYDLVVCARSTADSPARLPGTIDETAELAREQGADVLVAPLDVRDEEAVAALADTVYERFGRCDLLINNAAVGVPGATLENSTKRWRLATDINIHGPFYLIYYFCPRMREAGEGRVINISSGASVNPGFRRVSYTTTKRALEAMTEGFAIELEDSVAVNCIRLELGVWTEGYAFHARRRRPLRLRGPRHHVRRRPLDGETAARLHRPGRHHRRPARAGRRPPEDDRGLARDGACGPDAC